MTILAMVNADKEGHENQTMGGDSGSPSHFPSAITI